MSWLKSFGQKFLKGLEMVLGIAEKVLPFAQSAASIAEIALPADAPLIAAGADVLTAVSKYVVWLQESIGAFIGSSTLDQRMAAIEAFTAQAVQKWFAANFPGTAQIQDQSGFQRGISLIGRGISDVLASLSTTAGVAQASASAIGSDALTLIAKYIQWAEFTANALLPGVQAGSQKAQAIAAQSEAVVMDWIKNNLAGASSVQDQAKFQLGVGEIQNGIVSIFNSLKPTVATVQPIKS